MQMTKPVKRADGRLVNPSEAPTLGINVAGFIYCNGETGECTNDQNAVLRWVSDGVCVTVCGYYSFQWGEDGPEEVWY